MYEFSQPETDPYALSRQEMVRGQLVSRGISDKLVLDAMSRVPREQFVPESLRSMAYDDCALPIDAGQTISQPYTVAFMCQSAEITRADKVLEIGTGSGYGAAVLSYMCRQVHTVERIPLIAKQAEERLSRLGFRNVQTHIADGTIGLAAHAPYDAIVVTAGACELPKPLVEQLSEGGRIVIPIGSRSSQEMCRFVMNEGILSKETLGGFVFVPLIGEHGWHD